MRRTDHLAGAICTAAIALWLAETVAGRSLLPVWAYMLLTPVYVSALIRIFVWSTDAKD